MACTHPAEAAQLRPHAEGPARLGGGGVFLGQDLTRRGGEPAEGRERGGDLARRAAGGQAPPANKFRAARLRKTKRC